MRYRRCVYYRTVIYMIMRQGEMSMSALFRPYIVLPWPYISDNIDLAACHVEWCLPFGIRGYEAKQTPPVKVQSVLLHCTWNLAGLDSPLDQKE